MEVEDSVQYSDLKAAGRGLRCPCEACNFQISKDVIPKQALFSDILTFKVLWQPFSTSSSKQVWPGHCSPAAPIPSTLRQPNLDQKLSAILVNLGMACILCLSANKNCRMSVRPILGCLECHCHAGTMIQSMRQADLQGVAKSVTGCPGVFCHTNPEGGQAPDQP